MTKEEWTALENLLITKRRVDLTIDGYHIALHLVMLGATKANIIPYVNGAFEGKWLTGQTEEAVRFMRPVSRSAYTAAEKAGLKKVYTAKMLKLMGRDLEKKITYYAWGWSSFESLKRHLIKNNKSIEMAQKIEAKVEA